MRVLSGAGQSDTVYAKLAGPLVVEVHDSLGAPAPAGTEVRFIAAKRADGGEELSIGASPTPSYAIVHSAATDTQGRVSVLIRLGHYSGAGRVAISVPALGLLDTARFDMQPGAATNIDVHPIDTVTYSGRPLAFRAAQIDKWGNPRNDPITFTITGSSSGATISQNGTFVATEIGRYTLNIKGDKHAAGVSVSVAPRLRAVVSRQPSPYSVELIDLDGSNAKKVASAFNSSLIGVRPVWMPGGDRIVYAGGGSSGQQLWRVDTTGTSTALFPTGIAGTTDLTDPAPSMNGQFLYFAARGSRCTDSSFCLYRSRVDGTAPEPLGTTAMASTALQPSPSPDGSKVAISVAQFGIVTTIRVFDVATGAISSWSVSGSNPAWSPDGSLIAYVGNDQSLRVVASDGTGDRVIKQGFYARKRITWTSDMTYVLAGTLPAPLWELVEVRTGLRLPLVTLQAFVDAAIR